VRPALWLVAAALAGAPGPAAADEPSGCGAFKWPLDRERAALTDAKKPAVVNGGALTFDAAATLKLAPLADAGLPEAPERAPKSPQSYAGHFQLEVPAKAGAYKVTISSEGWIDVIDGGHFLHPTGFSGAVGCGGARKSVKFNLPARPVVIQLSDIKSGDIAVIVSPVE
jgi:hypothetical protein